MLTAVIRAPGSAHALAATFSVLIPAVADGFLGHAVVVDTRGENDLERIADATGASYLRAGAAEAWQGGAAAARGDRLLLLDAGDVPQLHWVEAVERHLLTAPGIPALLPLRGLGRSLRERAAIICEPRALRPGLVVPKGAAILGRLAASPQRLPVGRERADG
ncbi:glycosyltransferase family A protein [Bosea sp. (in: a-proteobacteria)]|uniref:glycosyltransferase family A protein n=1 Tax=Bosea sp. (in: a-proteobacteria) TaxID=1871050 RepID=UPI001AC2B21A|nr:glycosyltransferase family A protein [Bosea sp. (in: a-proteobacteria)]MBN9444990.1 glycosyltransferase family 2 protein [Bosea sp. (in: a-proteobacteria)]